MGGAGSEAGGYGEVVTGLVFRGGERGVFRDLVIKGS